MRRGHILSIVIFLIGCALLLTSRVLDEQTDGSTVFVSLAGITGFIMAVTGLVGGLVGGLCELIRYVFLNNMRVHILLIVIFLIGCALLLISRVLDEQTDVSTVFVSLAGIPGFIMAVTGLVGGLVGVLWELIHYVFLGPIERRERARFFLELLSLAEESGQSIEQTIIYFSKSGERSLGDQFDQIARHIKSGLNLPEALARVPGCLPAQVVATLQVGHETGGVGMTLPAARENLREKDRTSQTLGSVYNAMVLSFGLMIMWVLMVFVVPKFLAIGKDMDMLGPGNSIPGFLAPEYNAPHMEGLYGVVNQMIALSFAISNDANNVAVVLLIGAFLCLNYIFVRYVGGSRLIDQLMVPLIIAAGFSLFFLFLTMLSWEWGPIGWALGVSVGYIVISSVGILICYCCEQMGWFDPFRHLLPWHRKRLQRDYSHMLALLLDSGVSEEKAVELAAQGTSSRVIKKRARRAIAGLRAGLRLTEAIKLMDNSREFQWRLTNALQTEANFADALSGWHQSLSARADRQQQTFVTLCETSMILFFGLVVFCVMAGCFGFLQHIMMKL